MIGDNPAPSTCLTDALPAVTFAPIAAPSGLTLICPECGWAIHYRSQTEVKWPADHRHEKRDVRALTLREREVLRRLLEGYRATQIAMALKISVHTVRKHLSNLRDKTDTHNQAELVGWARRASATLPVNEKSGSP